MSLASSTSQANLFPPRAVIRMAERYAGIPQPTLSGWVIEKDGSKALKPPPGKDFRVIDILAADGNTYSVVEASDWFSISMDGGDAIALLLPRLRTREATFT